MGLLVPPLFVALIPVGALTGAALDSSLRHRPRFRLRFAGFVIGAVLPQLAVGAASAAGIIGDSVILVLIGLFWGLGMLVLAPVLLFYGPGSDRGPSDPDDGGSGPAESPPGPTSPVGGLPLPDAEQSGQRLRGRARLTRTARRGRGSHAPSRRPARLPRVG